jgi:hypothetical protein
MLPVAVEIAPPNAPREQVAVLLAACSRAVAEAECVLAADAPAGGTHAVAIVTWRGDAQVLVEVGLRVAGAPIWRSRSMTFGADDETAERWRAVGFMVGTLARGAHNEDSEASPAPVVEQPKKATPPASVPNKPPPPRAPDLEAPPATSTKVAAAKASLDVGILASPVWAGARVGGLVRARLPFYGWLRTVAALNYSQRSTSDAGLSGRWVGFALGLGGQIGDGNAEVAGSLDLRADYLRASASDMAREQHVSRVRPGVGLTLSAAWMPSTSLGLFVAGDFALMSSRTDLYVVDRVVQSDPAFRASGEAGVRVRLW